MSWVRIVALLLTGLPMIPIPASAAEVPKGADASEPGTIVSAKSYVVRTFVENGKQIDEIIVPGRPPVGYRAAVAQAPEPNVAAGTNSLTEVPAFDWSYGCSATSAAMMMGYYDRHGYPNMYSGPTNGGVCPLNNSVWGHTSYPGVTCGECPLSAAHQGIDGRATRGHVDDYWIDYNNPGPDPYISNGWAEHAWGECTADFMGTNQSKYGSSDGATTFYNYTDGSVLCDYSPGGSSWDGCHGLRLFAQSRGYTVVSNCSQYIYGYNGNTKGFTFAQYCAEIDAGRPVLIQVSGHTMLGFGYNTTGNVVYLHDTWDYNDHSMTWGGSYSGMQHYGVVYFRLAAANQAITTDQSTLSVPEGGTATFGVKLKQPPSSNLTVSVSRYSGDGDISVQSGSSLTFNSTNYNDYQYVTLAAAHDPDALDDTAVIRCSASGWESADVDVTATDDDSLTVSQMKQLPDGTPAACGHAIVTAVFGKDFYIEDDDRTCGMKVSMSGHGLSVGARAALSGTIQTGTDGERLMVANAATIVGDGWIAPVGLANRWVGGGDWMYDPVTGSGQQGIAGSTGLGNIGLLVRTSGRVVDRQDPMVAYWDFDTDPGWTYEGMWAWGQPTGGGSHGLDPTGGYTGANVVGYNLAGDYSNSMGSVFYATTPAIDCSGRTGVRLRFRRWLAIESSNYDHANIQISDNGTTWTTVWNHSQGSFSETAWSYQDYDISAKADNQPTVFLRWGMGPTDSSVTYPGWNIDDVQIAAAGEPYCVIDDGSGVLLKVTVPAGVAVPAIGSHICVTGVSSCEKVGSQLRSVLKVRSGADID